VIDSSQAQSVVFIIDDDESLRSGLKRLFRSVGLQAETSPARLRSFFEGAAPRLSLIAVSPGMQKMKLLSILSSCNRGRELRDGVTCSRGHPG
jgi:FixJ family two-component response regulator